MKDFYKTTIMNDATIEKYDENFILSSWRVGSNEEDNFFCK